MTTPIFAYGTLQPGGHYWPLVAHLIARVEPAQTTGYALYDLPEGYPCAVPGAEALHGTLLWVQADKAADALAVCDAIEGAHEGEPEPLYVRERCQTASGQEAWIYVYAPARRGRLEAQATRVDGGDWVRWRAKT